MSRRIMVVATAAFMLALACPVFARDGEKQANDKQPAEEKDDSGEKTILRPIELRELVVTPGRTEERVEDITESVSVVTSSQLEDSAAIDVTESLRTVPGLFLRRNGGIGGTSVPFLRGTLGMQTIVLIDGIQVNDPTLGYQFDFDDLDSSNIERIEVIRGAAAGMYGPGAVGGVINIITRRGQGEPRNIFKALGGSFGTSHVQAGSTGAKNGFSHSFAISQLTSDNAVAHNQTDKTTLSGRMRFVIDEKRTLDFFSRFVTSRHEEPYEFVSFPAHIEYDSNITRRQDQLALGSKFTHKICKLFSWDAFISMYDSTSRFNNEADDGSGTPEFLSTAEARVITGRMQASCNLKEIINSLGKKSRLIVGGEWTWEDTFLASTYGLTPDSLQNRAGYAQIKIIPIDRVLVTGGLRADGHSTYGTTKSPAAGIKIKTWRGGSVRSGWSRSYRPPSTIELTDPFYGNPDLKKERRDGFDAGILQTAASKKVKLEATYFQTKIEDNIGYDSGTFKMENFDTYAEGIECYAAYAPNKKFTVEAAYTHTAAINLKNKLPLAGRSRNFGGFRISRHFGPCTTTISGFFSEKVPPEGILDEKGNVQKKAGNAELVNFSFLYKITKASKLILKATNLLDKRFRASERTPRNPGIGVFVGISTEL